MEEVPGGCTERKKHVTASLGGQGQAPDPRSGHVQWGEGRPERTGWRPLSKFQGTLQPSPGGNRCQSGQ